MLPRAHRVTDARDFSAIIRDGRRGSARTVVVHARTAGAGPPRAGFVIGRRVGGSVVRHRVVRRLRHQVQPLLDELPAGTDVVVRALPSSAGATSRVLARDLTRALSQALARTLAHETRVAVSQAPRAPLPDGSRAGLPAGERVSLSEGHGAGGVL